MFASQAAIRVRFVPWLLALVSFSSLVQSFSPLPTTTSSNLRNQQRQHHHHASFTTLLHMVNNPMALRKGITLPLLDIPDPVKGSSPTAEQTLVVVPLPSDHLPTALRDLNIYGMELRRPVHKLILKDAVERASTGAAAAMMGINSDDGMDPKPLYGHVAWKPPGSEASLVGAIGCVAEVIVQADGDSASTLMMGGDGMDGPAASTLELAAEAQADEEEEEDRPKTVVTCGVFRFVVREVVQTVPFPIAVVDELPDQEPGSSPARIEYNDFEDKFDDEGEDDEMYSDMATNEIMKELFQTLKSYVEQQVDEASNRQVSLLEQSILEDTGLPMGVNPAAAEQTRAEQIAATWISFQTSLMDICPSQQDMYYAVALMAAEVVDLKNPVRRKLLTMVDGVERLRYVLREVKDTAGMARARKLAQQITDSNDESNKDLQVGTPELPPWSREITKGMKLSYYWNEEWEWCEAEVIEDPVMIVDELLVTLRFEDGEVHKLPFSPDEKARWRPAS